MTALLLHAHYNISITDKECVWSKKSAPKDEDYESVMELFPPKKIYQAVKKVPGDFRDKFHEGIKSTGEVVGYTWFWGPCPENPALVPLIVRPQDIFLSKEYEEGPEKTSFLMENLKISETQRENVAQKTVGQSKNWQWAAIRKDRLTASNFGFILKASQRNRFPPSLFKRLLNSYNLDGVKSIQWDRQHESDAAEAFEQLTKLTAEEAGLWLHNSGVLGASPDRIVRQPDGAMAVVEIKCPFKHRNEVLD